VCFLSPVPPPPPLWHYHPNEQRGSPCGHFLKSPPPGLSFFIFLLLILPLFSSIDCTPPTRVYRASVHGDGSRHFSKEEKELLGKFRFYYCALFHPFVLVTNCFDKFSSQMLHTADGSRFFFFLYLNYY
jgi:hypothetical protein